MKVGWIAGLVSAALVLAGTASASIITQDTRNDNNSGPATASAFLTSFNALTPGGTGYGVTNDIATWNGLNNLYGGHQNVATKMTAEFAVTAAQAGNWNFEAGGDGGFGGALFFDGSLIGSNMSDFDTDPAVTATNIAVSAGTHTLTWITFENCCDGPSNEGLFQTPGAGSYTVFTATDGLTPVPEPRSLAILVIGVFSLAGVEVLRLGHRRSGGDWPPE